MINKWKQLDEEVYGTTDNMYWMCDSNGNRALFKPDVSGEDYIIEYDVCRLALFLDIAYSRVEPYTLNGVVGFLSIVEDTRRFHRVNGFDLYRNGEKYNSKPLSSGGKEYSDDIDYSLNGFKEFVTDGCFEDLCKVTLLDALCRNQDRHIGNIDFLLNLNGNIVSVAPLYDSVMSLSNSVSETALLGVTNDRVWNHKEMFHYLVENNFIIDTIEKLKTNDFIELCNNLEYGEWIYKRATEFLKESADISEHIDKSKQTLRRLHF